MLIGLMLMMGLQAAAADYQPQTGDLVFHRSTSRQAEAISRATGSPYTHVGVVVRIDGQARVLEAVEPVQIVPLATWAGRSLDDEILIRRPRSALSDEAAGALVEAGQALVGTHYDAAFSWSDERIYCSELVYKVFRDAADLEVGELKTLGDFDLSDPVVQKQLRARYGEALPLEEPMVSPGDQAIDEDFVTVCEGAVSGCVDGA
ncbi:MAG: hypothetical protein GY913_00495 [Proteobacteria bacterium]|nr:hypothetical protein [Pseudomonadota bacterium]MCP4915376.1 hypothetical protein [Pseudomonadota bacterium]